METEVSPGRVNKRSRNLNWLGVTVIIHQSFHFFCVCLSFWKVLKSRWKHSLKCTVGKKSETVDKDIDFIQSGQIVFFFCHLPFETVNKG